MTDNGSFTLRRMTQADRRAACTLQVSKAQLAFVDPIVETPALYSENNNAPRTNYVLEDAGVIVGFFQIAPSHNNAIVADLFVLHEVQNDAAQQGRGYGQLFIQTLPALLEQEYPEEHGVCLTVNCKNRHAYDLYRLGGFVDSGLLYHDGRSGPQHIMQHLFGPGH